MKRDSVLETDKEKKNALGILGSIFSGNLDNSAIAKVEKTLRNLTSPLILKDILKNEIIVDDLQGTALHIAIYKFSLPLVELLISFDACADIEALGQTPIQLIESLSLKSNAKEIALLKQIKAFILARERWQSYAQDKGMSLNRAVRLLENGIDAIPAPSDIQDDIVLIYGKTQIGKSTWLNYLHGTEYEIVESEEGLMHYVKKVRGTDEIMNVGGGRRSETIYPKIAPINASPEADFRFIDMPGFGETGSVEKQICVMASNKMLIHKLSGIKIRGLMFAVAFNDLSEGGYRSLRDILPQMKHILGDETDNFVFVITKIPLDSLSRASNSVINLKNKVVSELEHLNEAIEKEIKGISNSKSDDIKARGDIKDVLNTLLTNTNRIILGDITNQEARRETLRTLRLFHAKDPDHFNFNVRFHKHANDPIMIFRSAMQYIANEYLQLDQRQERVKKELVDLRYKIVSTQKKIDTTNEEMNLIKIRLAKATPLDKNKIMKLGRTIERIKICIEVADGKIYTLNLERKIIQDGIDRLKSNNNKYQMDTYEFSRNQQPDYNDNSGFLSSVFNRNRCDAKECLDKIDKATADERGRILNAVVSYNAIATIIDYTIKLHGCNFEEGVWNADKTIFSSYSKHSPEYQLSLHDGIFQGKISGKYDKYNELVRGNITAFVTLFGYENTKKEVLNAILFHEMEKNSKEERLKLEEGVRSFRMIDLSTLEIELGEVRSAPQRAEEKKTILANDVKRLNKILAGTREDVGRLESNRKEKSLVCTENKIILNQRFFSKISDILKILGLGGGDLDKYISAVETRFSNLVESQSCFFNDDIDIQRTEATNLKNENHLLNQNIDEQYTGGVFVAASDLDKYGRPVSPELLLIESYMSVFFTTMVCMVRSRGQHVYSQWDTRLNAVRLSVMDWLVQCYQYYSLASLQHWFQRTTPVALVEPTTIEKGTVYTYPVSDENAYHPKEGGLAWGCQVEFQDAKKNPVIVRFETDASDRDHLNLPICDIAKDHNDKTPFVHQDSTIKHPCHIENKLLLIDRPEHRVIAESQSCSSVPSLSQSWSSAIEQTATYSLYAGLAIICARKALHKAADRCQNETAAHSLRWFSDSVLPYVPLLVGLYSGGLSSRAALLAGVSASFALTRMGVSKNVKQLTSTGVSTLTESVVRYGFFGATTNYAMKQAAEKFTTTNIGLACARHLEEVVDNIMSGRDLMPSAAA